MNKFKAWFDDHKEGIKKEAIRVGYYTAGAAVGLGVGYLMIKNNIYRTEIGLLRWHECGGMKFFNPENGLELSVDEFVNLMRNFKNK